MFRATVGAQVRSFYEAQPFNVSTPHAAAARIRPADQTRVYEDLSDVLDRRTAATVCDLGCGGGWFALSVAVHRRRPVVGVDFCRSALIAAGSTAAVLGVERWVRLAQADIFALPFPSTTRFDVVNTLGVLHHTYETEEALRVAAGLVAPGGVLHVGLYHRQGRGPFLALFDEWREGSDGSVPPEHRAEAFARYRDLNRHVDDQELLWSWFVDQVLHPVEHTHALAGISEAMMAEGFRLRSSSLSRFAALGAEDDLDGLDRSQALLSTRRNVDEGRYFPGFFTALYERPRS